MGVPFTLEIAGDVMTGRHVAEDLCRGWVIAWVSTSCVASTSVGRLRS